MTTATQPQRPAHVPAEAQWNGEQWFTFNATAGKWESVPEAAAPAIPPLPPPGGSNGQEEKVERPAPVNPDHVAEYFNQRVFTGGEGKSWKFHQLPEGTWYEGIVARNTTRFDVVAQTTPKGDYIKQNGQYKWQLQVPMLMMPGGNYPDGKAIAIFKVGDARDKLSAAMQHSGAPITTDTLDDGTEVQGYLPSQYDYIRMTKIEDQKGKTKDGEGFTRHIYEVIHRCADDPYAQEFRARVLTAHRALEDAGPAPSPPEPGATPDAYVAYAHALAAYQAKLAGAPTSNGSTATAAATNGATTPAAAAPVPPIPPPAAAPSVPPVPPPASSGAAVQAAATQVVGADAGLPAATMPAPTVPPPVPPPAAAAPQNTPAAPVATATPAPAAVATPPATITREQWLQMQPAVRAVVSEQTGIPIPADIPTQ